jgi:hypothetical protein
MQKNISIVTHAWKGSQVPSGPLGNVATCHHRKGESQVSQHHQTGESPQASAQVISHSFLKSVRLREQECIGKRAGTCLLSGMRMSH